MKIMIQVFHEIILELTFLTNDGGKMSGMNIIDKINCIIERKKYFYHEEKQRGRL